MKEAIQLFEKSNILPLDETKTFTFGGTREEVVIHSYLQAIQQSSLSQLNDSARRIESKSQRRTYELTCLILKLPEICFELNLKYFPIDLSNFIVLPTFIQWFRNISSSCLELGQFKNKFLTVFERNPFYYYKMHNDDFIHELIKQSKREKALVTVDDIEEIEEYFKKLVPNKKNISKERHIPPFLLRFYPEIINCLLSAIFVKGKEGISKLKKKKDQNASVYESYVIYKKSKPNYENSEEHDVQGPIRERRTT